MNTHEHIKKRSVLPFEMADIFKAHLAELGTLDKEQKKVISNIINCRTQALGGHTLVCDNPDCSHMEISYNSCRDRHCPKCQSLTKERWILDRQKELLPVQYFHVVFTIPRLLAPIILQNKRRGYNLLFTAVSETLKEVAANPKNLNAQIGFIAVLHSWDQKLLFHPHIHCIIPGGGIAKDGLNWLSSSPHFFLSNQILATVFRGKFLSELESLHNNGELLFYGEHIGLKEKVTFKQLLINSCSENWVVYAKPSFNGPNGVIQYLGRYTHRVAISNYRIKEVKDNFVTFSFRDRKDGNKVKMLKVDALSFIRRFLLHILPKRFTKIRYFGFLGNTVKMKKILLLKELLQVAVEKAITEEQISNWVDLMKYLTGRDPTVCPLCKQGHLQNAQLYPPAMAPPLTVPA
jgi:hypothetical protein